jgi:Macrocin-O-methyltransferase (TylF)
VDSINDPTAVIAECGVYRGSTLLGMAHRLCVRDLRDVKLIGFDSFEGFPEPTTEDALPDGTYHSQTKRGICNDTRFGELAARIRLLGYSHNVRLIKGYFKDTLYQFEDISFSLVHLDCDLYESYMTCLRFFYPRILPGAHIVFDEYEPAASVYPGAQKAINSFLTDKPEKLERFAEATSPRHFIRKL